jgi:hypothetical protein
VDPQYDRVLKAMGRLAISSAMTALATALAVVGVRIDSRSNGGGPPSYTNPVVSARAW